MIAANCIKSIIILHLAFYLCKVVLDNLYTCAMSCNPVIVCVYVCVHYDPAAAVSTLPAPPGRGQCLLECRKHCVGSARVCVSELSCLMPGLGLGQPARFPMVEATQVPSREALEVQRMLADLTTASQGQGDGRATNYYIEV